MTTIIYDDMNIIFKISEEGAQGHKPNPSNGGSHWPTSGGQFPYTMEDEHWANSKPIVAEDT